MARELTTILVHHLPGELTPEDQDDLLRHYGAVGVRSMGHSGRMKHCAFARFENHETAANALKRLHQIEILGHRLNVEFATKEHEELEPPLLKDAPESRLQSKPSKEDDKEKKEEATKEPAKDFVRKTEFHQFVIWCGVLIQS
jgi:RNA recognition motif-containing protein